MQSILAPIVGPSKELHDLTGRVALITGGANGIGFEIAKAFASVGARVIMTNRKEEQGSEAIEKIKEDTPEAKIEWMHSDLSSLAKVKDIFSKFAEKEERLDILVLSAGMNVNQYGEDDDGIDRHFGLNWLGNYYLTNLLWPLLVKTSKIPGADAPRIIAEASDMHKFAPSNIHFGSISELNNKDLSPVELYGRTKLCLILGMWYLSEKIIKPNNLNIYAISVHPGAVSTDMQDQWEQAYPGVTGKLLKYANYAIGRSPEQGSYSALWAATSPEIVEKNLNGKYFDDPSHEGTLSNQAKDEKLAASLWNLSQQLVKERVGPDSMEAWQ